MRFFGNAAMAGKPPKVVCVRSGTEVPRYGQTLNRNCVATLQGSVLLRFYTLLLRS